ncbi:MAG: hypothetical protein KC431_03150 [Myxococcales bacterium]|nr:hypothetical protein [Myxococcales bacterium]
MAVERPGSGTRICFRPDPDIFPDVDFDLDLLRDRLDELSILHAGVEVILETRADTTRWRRPAGLADWVREQTSIGDDSRILHATLTVGELHCEVAWCWSLDHELDASSRVRSWVNSVETKEGGTHVKAFLRNVRTHAPSDDHRLVGALHVIMPYPRFESPIKAKLDVPEIAPFVKATVKAACLEPPRIP